MLAIQRGEHPIYCDPLKQLFYCFASHAIPGHRKETHSNGGVCFAWKAEMKMAPGACCLCLASQSERSKAGEPKLAMVAFFPFYFKVLERILVCFDETNVVAVCFGFPYSIQNRGCPTFGREASPILSRPPDFRMRPAVLFQQAMG